MEEMEVKYDGSYGKGRQNVKGSGDLYTGLATLVGCKYSAQARSYVPLDA